MAEKKQTFYSPESRGYKTKGRSYKERYIHDKVCPECGGTSVYRDEWATQISFKCMKRSCRHNWFEAKVFPKKEDDAAVAEIVDGTVFSEENTESVFPEATAQPVD